MALQKDIVKTESGFDGQLVARDVYFKIVHMSGTKEAVTVNVTGTSGESVIYSGSHTFVPDLDGPNFIAQAYSYLKTLPDFAGAADV